MSGSIQRLNQSTESQYWDSHHASVFSLLWYGILVEYMKRIWPHVDMCLGNPFQIIMNIHLWYYIKGMADLLEVHTFHGATYKKKKITSDNTIGSIKSLSTEMLLNWQWWIWVFQNSNFCLKSQILLVKKHISCFPWSESYLILHKENVCQIPKWRTQLLLS